MDIHNMTEDWVTTEVNTICDQLEHDKTDSSICTCDQCRQDAACYVLNRTAPFYVVSHRGVARVNSENFASQQNRADRTTLVYEAIRRVSHNQRPYASHNKEKRDTGAKTDTPVFNVPAIMGKVFNGLNFSPVSDCIVELIQNGKLVAMKDYNWQNPYDLVPGTSGSFTFWPSPVPAKNTGEQNIFQFAIKISGGKFESFFHSFTIPVTSEAVASSFSMERTFKLPDFYLFPPGEEDAQLAISE